MMKAGQLLCAIIFCLLSTLAAAQGKLLFHHLTLEDGLSEQTNSFIYKDSRGFVWISSINGLNRFDGVHIRQYTPNAAVPGSINGENIQSSFFEDSNGYMWFCSYVAINAYDPLQDTFAHVKLTIDGEEKTGYYVFYLDSQSNLWTIVEEKSIYKFNTKTKEATFVAQLKFEAARALMIERSQGEPSAIITYSTMQPSVEVFKLDREAKLVGSDVLKHPATGQIFSPRKIVNDRDSVIWFTQRDMLVKYHLEDHRFQFYPRKNIYTLEILNAATLLISVDKEGLWEFDKSTGIFRSQYVHEADNPSSLISNSIQYLSIDKDGGIWASSTGKGISFGYPDKNKFKLIRLTSLSDQSSIDLNGMDPDQTGNLFCSTRNNGLYTLSRDARIVSEWDFPDDQSQQRSQNVFSIFTDRDYNKWISSFKGLSVILAGDESMQHITDDTTIMWAPYQLDDGRIIFSASKGGLYEKIRRNGSYTLTRIDSALFDTEYLTIHQDKKGLIWINKQLVKIYIVDPVSFKILDSLPIEGNIVDIIEIDSSDIMWLSGSNGLFKINIRV